MNKRSKKEIKLQNTDKYTVRYGSLNKEIPEVIYIRAKTKIIPKTKKSDYSKDILGIKDEFNLLIINHLGTITSVILIQTEMV